MENERILTLEEVQAAFAEEEANEKRNLELLEGLKKRVTSVEVLQDLPLASMNEMHAAKVRRIKLLKEYQEIVARSVNPHAERLNAWAYKVEKELYA
jgi:hypothetical protein